MHLKEHACRLFILPTLLLGKRQCRTATLFPHQAYSATEGGTPLLRRLVEMQKPELLRSTRYWRQALPSLQVQTVLVCV